MDLETYETFELPVPADVNLAMEPGKEVYYIEAMGRRKLIQP